MAHHHADAGQHPAIADTDQPPLSRAERAVLDALRGISFGQVEVIVHSSRIVQITRSDKFRPEERDSL